MKKVVVKIGSSIIAPKGKLDLNLAGRLVKDILAVEKKGYKVVLVTSGAVACGLNKLSLKKKPQGMHSLMAISSLGQIILMDSFNDKFKKHKRNCAQLLLTWDDFDNRRRFMNIQQTINELLARDITPIINENDAVCYEEIAIGDNDRLSALVADLIGAKWLIMLSDVEGLMEGRALVKKVNRIDKRIELLVKKQSRTHTSGGMDTKLEAATIASFSGVMTRIAYGRKKQVVSAILSGKDIGTLFMPLKEIERSRKRWIHGKRIKGCIRIDSGAAQALLNKGKSLLSVGIEEVISVFQNKDAVAVVDKDENVVGCGLVDYSSDELIRAKKKRLDKPVIHRDNFVKAKEGWSYHPYRRFSKTKRP